MSRSNYDDSCDGWDLIRWRGAVASAIRGHRGQRLLQELLDALDAMPEKVLIAEALVQDGRYCALGVVGHARGLPLAEIDPEDSNQVAQQFDIADALAREIAFINDTDWNWQKETPAERWVRVRAWVARQLKTVSDEVDAP